MKKRMVKIISVMLCAVLFACSVPIHAFAAGADKKGYTFVFVHGLCGWGSDDGANRIFPYWGMMTGNLFTELERKGYSCVAAGVGTVSSAWDRACELYAQLAGGTVDYGAAHSAQHNHARYGRTYAQPIITQWDSDHKINLVGHSFGGVTVRLLVQLLGEGSEAERAVTPEDELSPLFIGGQTDKVYSVTTLAAPHNGTSFFEATGGLSNALAKIFCSLAALSGSTRLNKLFDPMLDQFGLSYLPGSSSGVNYDISKLSAFINSKDNAFYDLTIDGAAEINKTITTQPGVYYYSYAGTKTSKSRWTGNYVPSFGINALMLPYAYAIGKYTGVTAGGRVIDERWLENDGLVNTISARAPFNEPSTVYQSGKKVQPGVWYIMPTQNMDHLEFSGGMLNISWSKVRNFYLQHLEIVTTAGE